ncbi:hypothetical protein ACN4EG_23080 [Alkalinema pantanalense CENA528]|uniref:hypothetical protein n=1 Tax=Alkalinema pantanalense TaxID=1620705 RepID=UPI003D6E4852
MNNTLGVTKKWVTPSFLQLLNGKQSWRPTRYEVKTLGCELLLDFTAVKWLDDQMQWSQEVNKMA